MRHLRPVGEYISREKRTVAPADLFPDALQVALFDSGTAALASAVAAAVGGKGEGAEVILPAYGCPALVSATLYAGARPVLVDLETDRPWLDLDAVERAVSKKTAAVVAVNLLGLGERIEALRARIGSAVLIEDSAQAVPKDGPRGDLVILSFGRGKPVSLLGGGAVLVFAEHLQVLDPESDSGGRLKRRLALEAYNVVIHPYVYGILDRIPGLNIGETCFEPLAGIGPMPSTNVQRLAPNLARYWAGDGRVERELAAIFARCPNVSDLAQLCDAGAPLLRYPILARDPDHAADLEGRLRRLGATRFYRVPLAEIEGVAAHVRLSDETPVAKSFAARLLTLPTHRDVCARDLSMIEDAIRS